MEDYKNMKYRSFKINIFQGKKYNKYSKEIFKIPMVHIFLFLIQIHTI